MKYLHALSLIALCFSFSLATAQTAPGIEWQNTIGGGSLDALRSIIQTNDGGYLLGGYSSSGISGDKTEVKQGLNDYWVIKLDVSGYIEWQNTIGGNKSDTFFCSVETVDGGYLLGGSSTSGISGDKTEANQGDFDYWVVKLNSSGNIEWENTIGGSKDDLLYSIIQATDGGYLLGGYSTSGISGDKSEANQGDFDYWIVKLDLSGEIEWQNTIGGNARDEVHSVIQTAGGGYLVGGSSSSGISGDKTEMNKSDDYWVVMLSSFGNIEWQNTIGGNEADQLQSITQTKDGGYLLGGSSWSGDSGDKTEASQGYDDYWVVKLNDLGNIEWQNTIGGSYGDVLFSVVQTLDGDYFLGGSSTSGISGDKTEVNKGYDDYWIVKLDGSGYIEWQKTIGGNSTDWLLSIIQTNDSGFLMGGYSWSGDSGDKTEESNGSSDYWVVKLFPEIASECPSPTSLSTVDVAPTAAKLKWDAVSDAIGYQIRYKSPGISDWTITHSTNNQKTITGLTPNTQYVWKVKAVCSKSPISESESFVESRFITPLLKSEGGMFADESLIAEVYPNPVQNELSIKISIPASDVTIFVFDMQGKMIDLPTNIQNTQAQINTTALPYGFYTLQITDNKTGMSEVRKFVKQE